MFLLLFGLGYSSMVFLIALSIISFFALWIAGIFIISGQKKYLFWGWAIVIIWAWKIAPFMWTCYTVWQGVTGQLN